MAIWQWAGLALVIVAAGAGAVVVAGLYLLGSTLVEVARLMLGDKEGP